MKDIFYRIIAWIQLILFFTVIPDVLRYIWPAFLSIFSSNEQMYALVLVLVNICTFYGGGLVLMFIYNLKHPYFEQFKIIKDKKWPWEEDPVKWKAIRNKTLLNTTTNLFVVGLGLLVLELYIGKITMQFSADSFPSKIQNLLNFWALLFFHDFCFYWAHRFFHQPFIYPYIHKVHHQYTHNVCIAGQYFHPLEFIVTILLPTYLMTKMLGENLHFSTLCMWIFVMSFNSAEEHSGYDFPWSPFNLSDYNVSAQFHDFHHSHNIGTFGAQFNFYDKLFGTDVDFKEFMKKTHEKQAKQIGEGSKAKQQ